MEYDEPSVLTEYVCRHCVPQMTMFEREGLKVVYAREKAEPSNAAGAFTIGIMRRRAFLRTSPRASVLGAI